METRVVSNDGVFKLENIELVYQFVEIDAKGLYFNELDGELSSNSINLICIADIYDKNNTNHINVNVITNLERYRLKYLVKEEGRSFKGAKAQARTEVLKCFSISQNIKSAELISITDNNEDAAVLLAVSIILQKNRKPSEMSSIMNRLSSDIAKDGVLDNQDIKNEIIKSSKSITANDLENASKNIIAHYKLLGRDVVVPNIGEFIDFGGNGVINDDDIPNTPLN